MRPKAILLLMFSAAFYSTTINAQTEFADSVPQKWAYESDQYQTLPAADRWWDDFNDPVLTRLISEGIDNNFNIAIATRRMEMARQAIRQAQSGYYPQISLSAGWTKSRSSGNMTSPATGVQNLSYFSAGVDMAWEIDLFGKIRAQVNQYKDKYKASHADYIAAMNSLCAEIATSYLQLRTWQAQLEVAENHLKSQERVLKIAEARHEAGLASKLDVAQALTVYNSTEATIPALNSDIKTAINAIALLIGEYPESVRPLLESSQPLPDYRRIVAVGIPAELIRRRPDLKAAEYDVAAAAAAVGIAKKDFLPTLTLEGSIGVSSHEIGDLFKNHSMTYSIAPKLSWTVFDGFARNASLASARENMQLTIDSYNLALMTAIQEVDNAMVSYTGQLQQIQSYEKVVDQAQEELDLSLDLYKQGLQDFQPVAQAQITLLQYADQLTAAKGNATAALVKLYKALGGGWTSDK